jgi:hypothetical protein
VGDALGKGVLEHYDAGVGWHLQQTGHYLSGVDLRGGPGRQQSGQTASQAANDQVAY